MRYLAVLAGLLLPGVTQESAGPFGASPAPDRYETEHDARLAETWGEFGGPVDSALDVGQDVLRPEVWTVFEHVGASHWRDYAGLLPLGGGEEPGGGRGHVVKTPAAGELAGEFDWAVGSVDSPAKTVRFLRAPGATVVFVNGEPFFGDPARRGHQGVPVALEEGSNELLVAGIQGGFELALWRPLTRLVLGSWALHGTPEHGDWATMGCGWPAWGRGGRSPGHSQ